MIMFASLFSGVRQSNLVEMKKKKSGKEVRKKSQAQKQLQQEKEEEVIYIYSRSEGGPNLKAVTNKLKSRQPISQ